MDGGADAVDAAAADAVAHSGADTGDPAGGGAGGGGNGIDGGGGGRGNVTLAANVPPGPGGLEGEGAGCAEDCVFARARWSAARTRSSGNVIMWSLRSGACQTTILHSANKFEQQTLQRNTYSERREATHIKKRRAKSHAMTYSNLTGALIILRSLIKKDGHKTSTFTTPKATNCNNLH